MNCQQGRVVKKVSARSNFVWGNENKSTNRTANEKFNNLNSSCETNRQNKKKKRGRSKSTSSAPIDSSNGSNTTKKQHSPMFSRTRHSRKSQSSDLAEFSRSFRICYSPRQLRALRECNEESKLEEIRSKVRDPVVRLEKIRQKISKEQNDRRQKNSPRSSTTKIVSNSMSWATVASSKEKEKEKEMMDQSHIQTKTQTEIEYQSRNQKNKETQEESTSGKSIERRCIAAAEHELDLKQLARLMKLLTTPRSILPSNADIKINPKEFLQSITQNMKLHGIGVSSIRLEGSGASHVIDSRTIPSYNDIDITIELESMHDDSLRSIRHILFETLKEFGPRSLQEKAQWDSAICFGGVGAMTGPLRKMWITPPRYSSLDQDSWAIFTLGDSLYGGLDLKFVQKIKRAYQFSIDSFRLDITSLIVKQVGIDQRPDPFKHPNIIIESIHNSLVVALEDLKEGRINLENENDLATIRGGGLLKYAYYISRGLIPRKTVDVGRLQKYAVTRFIMDFPAHEVTPLGDSLQMKAVLDYCFSHFPKSNLLIQGRSFLEQLYRIVRSVVATVNHADVLLSTITHVANYLIVTSPTNMPSPSLIIPPSTVMSAPLLPSHMMRRGSVPVQLIDRTGNHYNCVFTPPSKFLQQQKQKQGSSNSTAFSLENLLSDNESSSNESVMSEDSGVDSGPPSPIQSRSADHISEKLKRQSLDLTPTLLAQRHSSSCENNLLTFYPSEKCTKGKSKSNRKKRHRRVSINNKANQIQSEC